MKKFLIILVLTGYAYSVNGTITFYDGTSLSGELSSSDTRYIFIIPDGLVMPEKIPVVDVESLNLDNGIILVQDGVAQQTYIDGKFSLIERKTVEQSTTSNNEDANNYESLGNLDYFSINGFYGMPIYYRPSLQLDDGSKQRTASLVDGRRYRSVSSFINHQCKKGGNLDRIPFHEYHSDKEYPHVGFFANCDIDVGQEKTFNYKKGTKGKPFERCYCDTCAHKYVNKTT